MTWYLRLEGVNLSNFVYDTQDLSTIRGGGLLLLDAVAEIRDGFRLNAISSGASSGLFDLGATDAGTVRGLGTKVDAYLKATSPWRHATFVVDTLDTEDFPTAREGLLALNRWRQMQAPSLAVPREAASSGPCALDRVRPATRPGPRDAGDISRSVAERRDYGVEKKRRRFYAERAGRVPDDLPLFVNDLSELTQDADRGNLHHKMALIHLDGNGFGALQTELCRDPLAQAHFDREIKDQRKALLANLLDETCGKGSWTTPRGRHRMETLLWGGDEITWVVPAWVGLWTLGFFFDRAKSWTLLDHPVTHCAGLVLCHHNAPIHRVAALARNLCDVAKGLGERTRNLVTYQVLESFDHAGVNPAAVAALRWPPSLDQADRALDGERLTPAWYAMGEVAPRLPRRRIHDAVAELYAGRTPLDEIERQVHRGLEPETLTRLDGLRKHLNGKAASWVHLGELWDYLGG